MKSIIELPEEHQMFLTGLAMQHMLRAIMSIDAMDLARIRFDCLRCSDEDLRETEAAWDRDPEGSPKFGLS